MKVLEFTVGHAALESLMCAGALRRVLRLEDLGHARDHYRVTALVRDEMLDTVIEKSSGRPRWVKWP